MFSEHADKKVELHLKKGLLEHVYVLYYLQSYTMLSAEALQQQSLSCDALPLLSCISLLEYLAILGASIVV